MSTNPWDCYKDNLKGPDEKGTYLIQEAAIWGRLPGEVKPWTTETTSFPITAQEVNVLTGNRSGFLGDGPLVGGLKCMVLTDSMDDEKSYCLNMKTKQDANKKSYTVVVGKTSKALIIVKGVESAHAGSVTEKVYKMVLYLRERQF